MADRERQHDETAELARLRAERADWEARVEAAGPGAARVRS